MGNRHKGTRITEVTECNMGKRGNMSNRGNKGDRFNMGNECNKVNRGNICINNNRVTRGTMVTWETKVK